MSNSPDFLLKGFDKETGYSSGKLGVAWKNKDGSISINLDPGVGLCYSANTRFRLWPADQEQKHDSATANNNLDDDTPF